MCIKVFYSCAHHIDFSFIHAEYYCRTLHPAKDVQVDEIGSRDEADAKDEKPQQAERLPSARDQVAEAVDRGLAKKLFQHPQEVRGSGGSTPRMHETGSGFSTLLRPHPVTSLERVLSDRHCSTVIQVDANTVPRYNVQNLMG